MFWIREGLQDGEMEGDVLKEADPEGFEDGEAGKRKLKHNDRKRMAKRPIFKEWIDEFIPRCREKGIHLSGHVTRDQITYEALSQFRVKDEWDQKLREWKIARHTEEGWRNIIKGDIPIELDNRGAAIHEFMDIIMNAKTFQGRVPDVRTHLLALSIL